MKLSALEAGHTGRVVAIEGDDTLRIRLLEMGLVPGTLVTMRRTAPMGDPMELRLRGYTLTIRRGDAAHIEVESP